MLAVLLLHVVGVVIVFGVVRSIRLVVVLATVVGLVWVRVGVGMLYFTRVTRTRLNAVGRQKGIVVLVGVVVGRPRGALGADVDLLCDHVLEEILIFCALEQSRLREASLFAASAGSPQAGESCFVRAPSVVGGVVLIWQGFRFFKT